MESQDGNHREQHAHEPKATVSSAGSGCSGAISCAGSCSSAARSCSSAQIQTRYAKLMHGHACNSTNRCALHRHTTETFVLAKPKRTHDPKANRLLPGLVLFRRNLVLFRRKTLQQRSDTNTIRETDARACMQGTNDCALHGHTTEPCVLAKAQADTYLFR